MGTQIAFRYAKIALVGGVIALLTVFPASAQQGTPPPIVATAVAQSDSADAAASQAAANLAKAQADYLASIKAAQAARTAADAAKQYANAADIARAQEQANAAATAADQSAQYANTMLTAMQDTQYWLNRQSADNSNLRAELAQAQTNGKLLANEVLALRKEIERLNEQMAASKRDATRPLMDSSMVFALAAVVLTGATIVLIVARSRAGGGNYSTVVVRESEEQQ